MYCAGIMYLRTTQQRRKDGRVVRYLQLAENYRNAQGQTVARVVTHLGREDQVDRAALERLVRSVVRFLGRDGEAPAAVEPGASTEPFVVEAAWELGGPHVIGAVWEELGVAKTLQRAARRGRYATDVERAILVMVCQRCLEPGSKLEATRWLGDEVRVPGIGQVTDDQLYRAMDFLLRHADAVQEAVFFSVASLLNLEVDLVFFDTTSTYFEIEPDPHEQDEAAAGRATDDERGEQLRRLGHSKDQRPDLPQVVIGLAVTKTGIPVRCWVWPGNTSDQTLVEQVRDDLRGWKLDRSVFVADSGFSSRENLAYLRRAGGHYISGIRMRAGMAEVEAALSRQGRYRQVTPNLAAKEVWLDRGASGEKRYIVCRNDDEASRDRARREQLVARLDGELAALKTLDQEAHHKRECTLRTHASLGRYLRQMPSGRLLIDRDKIKEEERLDGKYLIETSDATLSAEDAALAYRNLQEAERAFRDLKGRIGLRPVYHRLDERIRAHVLLCFLALLVVRVCETRSPTPWPVQRRLLRRLKLVRFRSKDGAFEQRTELDTDQKNLLRALNVAEPAGVSGVNL